MKNKINFLAYYLPQYHPIPENDQWWGKGFTEWTNVTKAKPLFEGHYQPILPADLGFYDLRISEVQVQQAELAKEYGIDGFVYYHYWFGNQKMLLEKPAEAMLQNKAIDIPFCFCWANESWKGIWHGINNDNILMEQLYPGEQDIINHFNYLLPFFKDERYIKIDGKPMFHIYKPIDILNTKEYLSVYNRLAIENGFEGIYFVSNFFPFETENILEYGLDAQVGLDLFYKVRYKKAMEKSPGGNKLLRKIKNKFKSKLGRYIPPKKQKPSPMIYEYNEVVDYLKKDQYPQGINYFPCIIPNWDNTARAGINALIFKNSNPDDWAKWISFSIDKLINREQKEKFIVIKSWNEWAEGNYLEPCTKFGYKWLEQLKKAKDKL